MSLLLEQFDGLLTTPEAVDALGAQILGWAVQGMLVPQNPDDEPASMLLEKINSEKAQLVEEGKIRKSKPLPEIDEDEIPYDLPSGWEWERLDNLVKKIGSGSTPKGGRKVYTDTGTKFIRSQNVWNDGLRLDGVAYISDEINERMSGSIVKPKDVLLNITGASIARSALVPDDFDIGNVNQHVSIIRLINLDLRNFVHLFIISPIVYNMIMDVQVGVSREGLSMTKLKRFPIPIPPLAEQKRIVAKVESLLAQTAAIKERLTQSEAEQRKLNQSALYHLTSAPSTEEFQKRWHFVKDNFDLLYSHPENVADLKQTILQLAVQGKLVNQDPNDEPASVLLEKIKAEKAKLLEEGKIRKSKPLPEISEDEIPYDLPSGWEPVKLGNITLNIHYGYTASADFELSDYRLLRITDIQDNKVDWFSVPGCEIVEKDVGKYLLSNRDILIARTGGTVGKSFLVEDIPVKAVFASYLIRAILPENIDTGFIKLFLDSPWYWGQLIEKSRGGAQPNVNAQALSNLIFFLPPLVEQRRIVEKAREYIEICDELEAGLGSAHEAHGRLVEAVLREAE